MSSKQKYRRVRSSDAEEEDDDVVQDNASLLPNEADGGGTSAAAPGSARKTLNISLAPAAAPVRAASPTTSPVAVFSYAESLRNSDDDVAHLQLNRQSAWRYGG